ncbi:hypothetical protein [Roseibacillus persicicus]|uniref:Uncharacterized protein n=1 Tax=Roseibacillus persicicus TaxID=454148 RepID=A0A918TCS7_9BACT|nr:hypothetical protein [Roseibacillus persicicus]GHC41712.1 hypothetical protein GCM10007100_03180 [Roseibacillus persicicus]
MFSLTRPTLLGICLLATGGTAWAGVTPMTHEQHLTNGLYNLGDALWAIFGALLLLALSLLIVGLKVAKALENRPPTPAKKSPD